MTLLLDSPAVYRRPDGIVMVAGPDRLAYLHSMLSQSVEDASPGTAADFLYLDAKGNPLAAGRLVVHAERVLAAVPPDVAPDFAAALEKFKFLMQVEATDRSDDWAVASVRGDGTVEVTGAPTQPMTGVPHGPGMVVRGRSGGVDLLGPSDWVADRVAGLDLPQATAQDWERWRIRSGVPGWRQEISSGRRAQELGLLPTHVHLRKGCYPGQESIAKIYNLGRPRRALAVVASEGDLAAGVAVEGGPKDGEVTSAAPTDDGSVGLALLPLDRDGALLDQGLHVGGTPVRVLQRVAQDLPQPGATSPAAGR